MKRCIFFCVSLIAAAYLCAVEAEVVAVNGKVEIQTGGAWHTAMKGEKITASSVISTGFKATLTFKIDGSTFTVNPLTRLKLKEIIQKENAVSSKVFLDTGSMKADVKPKTTEKVNFQVQTPIATASVRGTAGEISATGTLVSTQGVWKYQNGTRVVYVPKDSSVVVNADDTIATGADALKTSAGMQTIADVVPNISDIEPPVAVSTLEIEW